MKVSSFDIFDTCLLRKCGTPENFFDVFSLRVFNGEVEEWARQEFVAARYEAQRSVQSPSMTLQNIWDAFSWTHPQLKSKEEICQLEQETEREMLVPVLKMRDKVNESRAKGHHIIFISDMYLSSRFLISVMREHRFMQEGDSLYVSCECGMEKRDGELFKHIKEKEGLSYRSWRHIGDNKLGDYKAPRKLGIRAELIIHEYTPYQKQWLRNDYSLGYRFASVMAGTARAIKYSSPQNDMTDFVTDIIAPLYIPFVFRVLKDAEKRNIQRLYFCARDAYLVHFIAKHIESLFPSVDIRWLYISQKALYEGDENAKFLYFQQEGLASKTDKVAIVDIRSSGRTQSVLNALLEQYGCRKVFGYYFEEGFFGYKDFGIQGWYYTEANGKYVSFTNPNCQRLFSYWQLFEQFFSLQSFLRTIDYKVVDGVAAPVFDEKKETDYIEAYTMCDNDYYRQIQERTIHAFLNSFVSLGLNRHVSDIFNYVSLPTLCHFTYFPERHYLSILEKFHVYNEKKLRYTPYVKKMTLFELLHTKGTTSLWHRASLVLSVPYLFLEWYKKTREASYLH